ncbi:hypothetical protein [Pseudofrankia sp. BMG5.37]|uniref:hypothetical protein n=1 Tax=Pseudofrankia sp. BMG5.37 TaxID=3050035 RepID=UPI0028955B6B|nr:hypothetical protein [Pseudofrankia sp. BMG5.37]MDT3443891.1 hypothetical protein [Pseudofrankia sp. BMG5.37]
MSVVRGNPVLIQSRFGSTGNFEFAIPSSKPRGIVFLWRDNDAAGMPWSAPTTFGQNAERYDALTMIQSNFGSPGNLEMISRNRNNLNFFWRDSQWNGPIQIASGADRGNPVLIQSRFGTKGNFELVYPGNTGINFMWRNNDAVGMPWSAPTTFGQNMGIVEALTMIQSNFGNPGNLELIARTGDKLNFFWRDSQWNGPIQIASGAGGGNPVLIQSRFGTRGNFELVYPAANGGINFMWRNNDAVGMPWSAPTTFGQNAGHIIALTMIQSNFGNPGNLELIALNSTGHLNFFWRDSGPNFAWNGPFRMVIGSAALTAVQTQAGRFIRVDGSQFSQNANVAISYDIVVDGSPTTHQTGQHRDTTDANGSFSDDIKVNIGAVSGAQVNVVDENTRMHADAFI